MGEAKRKRRRRRGRPAVLDREKRRIIVALLFNGSSRRSAAAYVGCAATTIARTAARDPAFALEIDRAERHAEVDCLRLLRAAAREPRYWRAAAWMLERRNPEDFALRKPTDVSPEQAVGWVMAVLDHVFQGGDQRELDRMMQQVEQFADEAAREQRQAAGAGARGKKRGVRG